MHAGEIVKPFVQLLSSTELVAQQRQEDADIVPDTAHACTVVPGSSALAVHEMPLLHGGKLTMILSSYLNQWLMRKCCIACADCVKFILRQLQHSAN